MREFSRAVDVHCSTLSFLRRRATAPIWCFQFSLFRS